MAKSKPLDEIFWNLVFRCLLVNENSPQSPIFDFGLFWPFVAEQKAKIDQKWRKLAKSKPFDEIIWNLVSRRFPTKENSTKKLFFYYGIFWPVLPKKKLTKNEENWQNPNRLIKFSDISYLDASQQKKMLQKNFFGFRPFLAVFLPKNSQNWPKMMKIEKIQTV